MCFNQYQASSAVLGRPGRRWDCYLMHRRKPGGWLSSEVCRSVLAWANLLLYISNSFYIRKKLGTMFKLSMYYTEKPFSIITVYACMNWACILLESKMVLLYVWYILSHSPFNGHFHGYVKCFQCNKCLHTSHKGKRHVAMATWVTKHCL